MYLVDQTYLEFLIVLIALSELNNVLIFKILKLGNSLEIRSIRLIRSILYLPNILFKIFVNIKSNPPTYTPIIIEIAMTSIVRSIACFFVGQTTLVISDLTSCRYEIKFIGLRTQD